jgi:glycerophosphoryl diester phosphodiesterase
MTLVIGHGGASAVARSNTLRSFDFARDHGADMIEFDVRSHRRRLVLAHTHHEVSRRGCVELDDALAHLAQPSFDGIGLNVDIKSRGCEGDTLTALRSYGLTERALISSQRPKVIDRVRELDSEVATAISVGGVLARRANRWAPRAWRDVLLAALDSGRFGDVMLQYKLVTADMVASVEETGSRLFAWTVDCPERFAKLSSLGVAGVVTRDPLLVRAGATAR